MAEVAENKEINRRFQRLPVLSTLPSLPGIYQMLNAAGEVIYVGKAKNLKKRVYSYFVSTDKKEIKTQVLVAQIADIKITVTPTEQDALSLENKLIKRLKPRYNIALKDDKSYPFIKITTQEEFPRVIITRDKKRDGALYFGPYALIGSSKLLQRTITDLFPIRECTKPITLDKQQRKCINMDIGKCIGPCVNKTIKATYDDLISDIILLIKGQDKGLIAKLKKQMVTASEQLQFEQAASIRDQISKIELIQKNRRIKEMENSTGQIWLYRESDEICYGFVQTIEDGAIINQKGFFEKKEPGAKVGLISKMIINAIEDNWIASDISSNTEIYQDLITTLASLELNPPIKVICPKIGPKKALIDAAEQTAGTALLRLKTPESKIVKPNPLQDLQKYLNLMHYPKHMVCFDISHLQGTDIVASCVDFKEGKPDKSGYMRFNIRQVEGQSNDPLSMKEVVYRRLKRSIDEDKLPNLIVIDGGVSQLNFACQALTELELIGKIDIISLAKKREEVYLPGNPDPIQMGNGEARRLLQRIRDEAHRFAVTFQRTKRQKSIENSILLKIPGIGPERVNQLYTKFKTLNQIQQSSVAEIAKVGNMGLALAQQIMDLIQNEMETH